MPLKGHLFEGTTSRTVRGYTFTVEIYDSWSFVLFLDPQRDYAQVARVSIPERLRTDVQGRDALMRMVARDMLAYYTLQHKSAARGIQFMAGGQLTAQELKDGAGVRDTRYGDVPHSTVEVPPEAPKPASRKKEKAQSRSRRAPSKDAS